MRKEVLFVALCILSLCQAQVGTWKTHMSYYEPQQIIKAGDHHLFVRASNSLYLYNLSDQSITTFDRAQQLNDTYLTKIAWNTNAKCLLVYYSNANIDITDLNGNVKNISSIYTKPMTQNKNLNSIYMYGQYAYLSMNFGVVKVNMERAEIAESYMLNKPISNVCISGGYIYARHITDSEAGCFRAEVNKNLIDIHNWEEVGENYPPEIYNATDNSAEEEYKDLVATLQPVGPKHNYFGFMCFKNGKLYTCSGKGSGSSARPGTVQVFDGSDWIIYQDDIKGQPGTEKSNWVFVDSYSLDVDPLDEKHVFVGGRTGLYDFYEGKLVKYYNKDNSILNTATTSNSYVLVPSVLFDDKANLWMLQQQVADNSIMEIDADGGWHSYSQEVLMEGGKSLPGLTGMIRDSRGLLWFINYYWDKPSFYCFDPNTKKVVNYMMTLANQDGVTYESYQPHCIAEDMDGNLWLGTNVGLFEIEASTIGSPLQYVTQVKVPRNDGTNYADYLMDGANIRCIVVDQANRKWIGTNGAGIYLISADNMEQLENFTSANSPLLSDNIESMAINHETGEVYIGTDQGLCSYMSDASSVSLEMTKDNVYAYPNPVVSGYDGLITIVGLTRDADVKILTVNGQLVAQGRSNGGMFTWNGCDSRGHRVASGVYMVATAKSDGTKGTVCKIAIIR